MCGLNTLVHRVAVWRRYTKAADLKKEVALAGSEAAFAGRDQLQARIHHQYTVLHTQLDGAGVADGLLTGEGRGDAAGVGVGFDPEVIDDHRSIRPAEEFAQVDGFD